MTARFSLQQLGWSDDYASQLTSTELAASFPARVASVERSGIGALHEGGFSELGVPRDMQRAGVAAELTVGDWVLAGRQTQRVERRLPRRSAIVRLAAGNVTQPQAIAANLDTLFVVTSCNQDLNPARLERYLAVALDAGVEAVIVLTKSDLCADPDAYRDAAAAVSRRADVVVLNALSASECGRLDPWLAAGRTVAFVGSSGVGKSTLINTLTGTAAQATAGIREDDARGRHTTTARHLLAMPGGAWLIDTPGMRELRIGAVEQGVDAAFDDVTALAAACRFRDCRHEGDAGCAVLAAIDSGHLERRRLDSYRKLLRESSRASASLRERHDDERRTGKLYKAVQARRRRERDV